MPKIDNHYPNEKHRRQRLVFQDDDDIGIEKNNNFFELNVHGRWGCTAQLIKEFHCLSQKQLIEYETAKKICEKYKLKVNWKVD